MDSFLSRVRMPESVKHEFCDMFSSSKLKSGEILFDYSSSADTLYFVREGRLAVYKKTGFLEKMQVIALLDPGAVTGETALFGEHFRRTRVKAIEDCVLSCLRKSDFKTFSDTFPESALNFMEYLLLTVSLRLEKTSERLARIL